MEMNQSPVRHPKLQSAMDRLKKRFAGVSFKSSDHNVRQVYMGDDSRPSMLIAFAAYTEESPDSFVRVYVDQLSDTPANHRVCIESRFVRNERHPRNEKRTTKEKAIVKLIDEYAKPFSIIERAKSILEQGHSALHNLVWKAERAANDARGGLHMNYGALMYDLVLGKPTPIPDAAKEAVIEFRERLDHMVWMKSNTNAGSQSAMQVIAFQVGNRWILNIFGGPTEGKVVEYQDFDEMPDFIRSKIALLKIAPHKDVLEDIGVKVEANSYFLYGRDLQQLRDQHDARKESQEESNCPT